MTLNYNFKNLNEHRALFQSPKYIEYQETKYTLHNLIQYRSVAQSQLGTLYPAAEQVPQITEVITQDKERMATLDGLISGLQENISEMEKDPIIAGSNSVYEIDGNNTVISISLLTLSCVASLCIGSYLDSRYGKKAKDELKRIYNEYPII